MVAKEEQQKNLILDVQSTFKRWSLWHPKGRLHLTANADILL